MAVCTRSRVVAWTTTECAAGALKRRLRPLGRVSSASRSSGKQLELPRGGRSPLDAIGPTRYLCGPEELPRPLADRQKPDDALFCLDDPSLPDIEMNAQRLREAANDVEDQRKTFCGLSAAGVFFVVLFVSLFFVLFGPVCLGTVAKCLAMRP